LSVPHPKAAVIGLFEEHDRLAVEQAPAGSAMKSVVAIEDKRLSALESALSEAMGKFGPDRTRLPIPDRSFRGTMGRTLETSVADWRDARLAGY
jgi:DNA-binding IclR family transcriptional regulator